jgi:PAS domain S-box-containing protein
MTSDFETAHVSAMDFRVLLDAIADAVIVANVQGKIVYINHATEALLGWTAEELLNQPLTKIQPARMHELHSAGFTRFLATRRPKLIGIPTRVPALRRDGMEIDIELALSSVDVEPSAGGDGDSGLLLVAVLRDLSERLELERQLDITRYLRATNQVATQIARLTDVDSVLHFTLTSLQRDFSAVLAQAWILDLTTGMLVPKASRGPAPLSLQQPVPATHEAHPISKTIRSRRIETIVGEPLREAFNRQWLTQERITTAIILPLVCGEEIFGCLSFFTRQSLPDEFIEALGNFAALIAASLQDIARVQSEHAARDEAEAERARAAFLAEAGALLTSILDEQQAMEQFADLLLPRMADWVGFDLITADGQAIERSVVRAANSAQERLAQRVHEIRAAQGTDAAGLTGQVITTRETRATDEITEQRLTEADLDDEYRAALREIGIRAYVATPLISRDRILGVLTLATTWNGLNRGFSPEDIRTVESLARRAALAVDNARLYRAEAESRRSAEHAADRIGRLYTMTASLGEAMNLSDVGAVVVQQGMEALNAQGGAVSLLSEDRSSLEIIEAVNRRFSEDHGINILDLNADVPIARAVRLAQPEWIDAEPAWDSLWSNDEGKPNQRYRAHLALPLRVKGEIIGGLAFYFTEPCQFRNEDRDVARTLAHQCAFALERARLYAAEQQAREAAEIAEHQMRFLAGAMVELASSMESTEMLERLADLAVPALADWSAIDVVDPDTGTTRRVASARSPLDVATTDTDQRPGSALDPNVPGDTLAVITSGESEFVPRLDASSNHRAQSGELSSYLRVPLRFRGRPFASLTLATFQQSRHLTPGDLRVAEDLVERASLALENTWLHEEQILAINRIHQLANEHRLVLSQIADGVIITDESGHITYANEAAHHIHGGIEIGTSIQDYGRIYDVRTLAGQPVAPEQLTLVKALTTHVPTYNAERRIRRSDGTEVIALASSVPLLGNDGRSSGAVLTLRDVTEARDMARQKDEFVIRASHDLKSPLTGIKGWAQLLGQRARRNEHLARERAAIDAIYAQADSMQRLIDRMLETIRGQDAQEPGLQVQRADLHQLVSQAVALHQSGTMVHEIRLQSPGPGHVIGEWDTVQIGQILDNLLGNAIKYSPEGGLIDIVLTRDETVAHLSVRDEGIGIPEEARPRIFDQFFRAANANAVSSGSAMEGLGLGLFNVRHLAKRHGGTIELESTEGKGSTFHLTLPLNPPTPNRQRSSAKAPPIG